tara:strand:+ start:1095 stop:1601 length:507 start_codon:yes stop_codon:yes gene_type:complete
MSKDFQWYLVRDNFLSQNECEKVIEIIDNNRNDSESTQDIELKEDKYLNKVWKIMKLSNDMHYNFDIDCVQLQEGKYYKKGDFKEEETLHSDFAAGPGRLVDINTKLTSVIFLNDDYWGGGLQIWNEKIESKQGRIVIFPSFAAHKVLQFYDKDRYTMLTWIKGKTFR